jgi:hypothetical protein
MRQSLRQIVLDLFGRVGKSLPARPGIDSHLAVAKRILYKHLGNLEPQQNKGGNNDATETPDFMAPHNA